MKTDVAIVGGGPAGATAAMRLAREGVSTVVIEKERFPRFHVGESMTGGAGELLRDLGLEQHVTSGRHAVKHGVKVLGSNSNTWFVPVMRRDEAGELADQITWQVLRSDFDKRLLDEAGARGATLVPGKALKPLVGDDGAVRGVRVRTPDGELDVESELLLDCSGQATFLNAQGITGEKYVGAYDKQIAIFSHVVNFERDSGAEGERDMMPGNTLIIYKKKFHWAWAIPLDDEIVSVGVVIPSQYFQDSGLSKEDFLRRELHELHPDLRRRLPTVEFVEEMHAIPNYSFQVKNFAGKGFICVGDSHRFLDPIFSFGLDVALFEAWFVTETATRYLAGEGRDSDDLFREHMVRCERRGDVYEDFIDAFWEHPLAFSVFVNSRYRESVIDAFAGRNFGNDDQPYGAVHALRKLLDRERLYDDDDGLYSVPIGSRYHPERAELWDAEPDSIATTERWMRDLDAEASAALN